MYAGGPINAHGKVCYDVKKQLAALGWDRW